MSRDPKKPAAPVNPDDPDSPAKPAPPPAPKKRRFSLSRRTIMIIIGAVILLFLCNGIISLFNDDAADEPTAEVAEASTATDTADQPVATDEPAAAVNPTEEPEPTDTPAPTMPPEPTAAPTDTPEPTPTLSPDQALRAAVADALGTSNRDVERLDSVEDENGRIEIDWAINDNLTENLTQAGAQLDATEILRAVAESGYDFDFVLMRGTFPLVDQLGNVEETKVVELFFSRELVDQINWDNFLHANIYDVADSAEIHPTFVRQ